MEIPKGLCQCGCGKRTKVATRDRRNPRYVKGEPQAFLPGHHNIKHGHKRRGNKTPEYCAYTDAKTRCNNPKVKEWEDYGGRGIKFLFNSFKQFFSEIGTRPPGLVLDRKNNDGNYEIGNIQWAAKTESNRNRRKWGKCQTE